MRAGVFTRSDIQAHLRAQKAISGVEFKPASKNRETLPPLRLRGSRVKHTDAMDAGGGYFVVFVWKDGAVRERRSFYCYLYLQQQPRYYIPLARVDYHPSHKGLHVVLNCEDERDLTNRNLPSCREFALKCREGLDPALDRDRESLVHHAMERLGIEFETPEGNLL